MVVLATAKTNTLARLPGSTVRPTPGYVRPPNRTRVTATTKARIAEVYIAGASALDVAEQLGIAKSTVLKTLRNEGIEVRPHGRRLT